MSKAPIAENMWLAYCKVKWPSLVIGSEEYDSRRHSYFVGMWAMMGILKRTPDSVIQEVLDRIHGEIKTELIRDPKAMLTANTLKL